MDAEDAPKGENVTANAEPAEVSVTASSPWTQAESDDESIVIQTDGYRASSRPKEQQQDFQGSRPQNEDDVLQVCKSLRAALQREGEAWGPFSLWPSSQDNVDAFATNDAGAELRVQVTRVEHDAWEALARAEDDKATLQRSVEKLVAAIQDAVDSKGDPSPQRRKGIPPAERRKLLLALDAIRSPGYLHDAVVAKFRTDYGDWAVGLGFQAIWLVGLTAARTYRLC
jgi:hypothetical protein